MVHTINAPPQGHGSLAEYVERAIDVGRQLGAFPPSGSPPGAGTAAGNVTGAVSSSSPKTGGVLSAATTVGSTTTNSTLSTLLSRVDKYGLIGVALLVVNLIVGLLLTVSACLMWIRRGRDTGRSTVTSYAPVRFRDPTPVDEEAYTAPTVKYSD